MSKAYDLLGGHEIPGFDGSLPIGENIRKNWVQELNDQGRSSVKSFELGICAVLRVAGRIPEINEYQEEALPFIVAVDGKDLGRRWFNRGFTVLAPVLDVDMNAEAFYQVPHEDTEIAYHYESDLLMSGVRRILSVNEIERGLILPPGTTEAAVFSVISSERYTSTTESDSV